MINSLSLPGYQLVDSDEQNEDIHFGLKHHTSSLRGVLRAG